LRREAEPQGILRKEPQLALAIAPLWQIWRCSPTARPNSHKNPLRKERLADFQQRLADFKQKTLKFAFSSSNSVKPDKMPYPLDRTTQL
jgi:hypothetical protein